MLMKSLSTESIKSEYHWAVGEIGNMRLDVVRDGRVLDSSASIGLFVLIEAEATDM